MLNKYLPLFFSLLSLIFIGYCFDFYYDYYDGYGSALLSGQLTPSIKFDDWFYYSFIGFVKIFSYLYGVLEKYDWFSIFCYSFNFIALYIFTYLILEDKKKQFLIFILPVSIFFSENFLLFSMNKTGFLLAFASLFWLFSQSEKPKLKIIIICYLLFTSAFLIRLEAAILSFVIALFTVVFLNITRISPIALIRLVWLSVYPVILIFVVSLWFKIDINNSNEFYKQIEPDVEYELMTRDNIVDIGEMTSYRDSLRYEAIYNGIWGDALTNDAKFLRLLIGDKKTNILSVEVFQKGWFELKEASAKTGIIPYIIMLVLIINLIYFALNEPKKLPGLILYQLTFLALLIVVGGYVKMTESALLVLYFMNFFTLLLLIYGWFHKIEVTGYKVALTLIIVSISVIKVQELNMISINKKNEVTLNKEKLNFIKEVASDKKLYLSGESLSVFFHSYQPFEKLSIREFKGLYIINSLAMSTIRPYKDYLNLECNCQSNNYASLFTAIKNEGDAAVILMSEETKDFLERYMAGVHSMEMKFTTDKNISFSTFNNYSAGFRDEKSIYFYTIL